MSAKRKVKVAFFDFACCEGCQVELTNLSDPIFVGLLDHVEFVEFREVMKERTTEPIDIAFVEGSFTRESDRARLEDIRKRASIVIAYGACAATAGINAMKNHTTDYKEFVYGKDASMPHLESQNALPISAAIKVDYALHGCPMDRAEFVRVVSDLLHGKQPVIPNYRFAWNARCGRRSAATTSTTTVWASWPAQAAELPVPPTASRAKPAADSGTTPTRRPSRRS